MNAPIGHKGNITAFPCSGHADIGKAALFFQSNEDFTIPVSFLVEDVATINGVDEVRQILYNSSLTVDLVGVADPPTVFVNDASGLSLSNIPLDLGGELTDTDVALGRRE